MGHQLYRYTVRSLDNSAQISGLLQSLSAVSACTCVSGKCVSLFSPPSLSLFLSFSLSLFLSFSLSLKISLRQTWYVSLSGPVSVPHCPCSAYQHYWCELTKLDRIRKKRIRGTTKAGDISKKVQESGLKWHGVYGHVMRRLY